MFFLHALYYIQNILILLLTALFWPECIEQLLIQLILKRASFSGSGMSVPLLSHLGKLLSVYFLVLFNNIL